MEVLIGDIGRYALHDGPGIRTTVFFKGCPLRCPWCHNPEFISERRQMMFYPDRCIGCGDCVGSCPEKALNMDRPQRIDRRRCTGCGQCAQVCPARALVRVGCRIVMEDLIDILLRDRLFYNASGGGVTFSGGEPTRQMAALSAVLRRLKAEKIHTALQTNGCFAFDDFQAKCLQYLDLIQYDLKISDPERHRQVTGAGNHIIWSNLARLKALDACRIIPRIPLIPGYTAFAENLLDIASRLRHMGFERYTLMPYHPFGLSKAASLAIAVDPLLPQRPMPEQELMMWRQCIREGHLSRYRRPPSR